MTGLVIARGMITRREADSKAISESGDGWRQIAEQRGLTAGDSAERPSLSGPIQGVSCSLSIEFDRYGFAHTRASADALRRVECSIGVYPNPGGVLGLLKSLVQEDITVGDEPFDQAFLIQANPDAAAASLLQAPLREHLSNLASRGFTAFTYENGRVTLQMPGVETDPEWLSTALDLVAEAGRWDPGEQPFR
jgi:hypothetical protein